MKKQDYIKELEQVRAGMRFIVSKISEIMGGLYAEELKERQKDACDVTTPENNNYLQQLN